MQILLGKRATTKQNMALLFNLEELPKEEFHLESASYRNTIWNYLTLKPRFLFIT